MFLYGYRRTLIIKNLSDVFLPLLFPGYVPIKNSPAFLAILTLFVRVVYFQNYEDFIILNIVNKHPIPLFHP